LKKHAPGGQHRPPAASHRFHTFRPSDRAFALQEPTDMPHPFRAALAALVLALPAWACAQTVVGGVKYDAATEVRGSRIQLNGAGVRYRGPFKVYAAALYLPRKTASAEEALAAVGAKRIAITMLRDIDAGELGRLFTRGVEDNLDKSAFSRLIPGLLRMSQLFSQHHRLAAGDSLTLDWVPGSGTVVSVRGVPQGEPFREPEFFGALLRIWLGAAPADWQLKELLLGRSPGSASQQ
jgi:hypothetical protein